MMMVLAEGTLAGIGVERVRLWCCLGPKGGPGVRGIRVHVIDVRAGTRGILRGVSEAARESGGGHRVSDTFDNT